MANKNIFIKGQEVAKKEYVDEQINSIDLSGKQDIMQFSTMPTASSETVGKIIQYTGTTDANYTNGYFYVGVTDGNDPATYGWDNINVQAGKSSLGKISVSKNPNTEIYLEDMDPGAYLLDDIYQQTNYTVLIYKNRTSNSPVYLRNVNDDTIFVVMKKPSQAANFEIVSKIYFTNTNIYNQGTGTEKFGNGYIYLRNVGNNVEQVYTTYTAILMRPNEQESISAKHTYTVLPESNVAPTTANQFTNKSYVDSKSTQVSTMPTATSETVGKIVQYTGTTDSTYTNGYFYIGTSDGEDPATYSWENLNVQDGSSSGMGKISIIENPTYVYLDDLEEGVYYFENKTNLSNYIVKLRRNHNDSRFLNLLTVNDNTIFVLMKKPTEINNEVVAKVLYQDTSIYFSGLSKFGTGYYYIKTASGNSLEYSSTTMIAQLMRPNSAETISSKHTYTVLPESNVTPTTNDQLTNKSYVDNSISTAVGNINTVLASLTTPSGNGGE